MPNFTPCDWLTLCGIAVMALCWFVSFRIVRERPEEDPLLAQR